jgi:predicted DsbA family dithiol-disulfide isomerase
MANAIPQQHAKNEASALPTIELYSDIHCPWAYMAIFRLRKIWPEYAGRVRVAFRSLSLEIRNERTTPKPILDQEIVLMARQEPELVIWPWRSELWKFVPTFLPAFEAEKAAALQGDESVWEYTWRLREAFFACSRSVCTRFELAAIAREAGLDVDRFLADWDSGLLREPVLAETRHGWNVLRVPGSPTFVLPSGKQVPNPGAVTVQWGPDHEVLGTEPADCPNGDCLQPLRAMLNEAVAQPVAPEKAAASRP